MQNSDDYPFVAPVSTCLSEDLLFFDTFSHSGSDKDNFDLVQFPSPVVIDLIKIIPLGQPVEAKIPGNVRLGATNPSNCELEFFINDLTKLDAHTMTDLGKFYCSEKDTDFNPPLQIQTDGLLLRGSYRTLTLAIFGQIVSYDDRVKEDQTIFSAASPPAQTPASPVASERDMSPYLGNQENLLQAERSCHNYEIESFDESTTQKSGEPLKDEPSDMIDEPNLDATIRSSPQVQDRVNAEDMSGSECGGLSSSFTPHDKKTEENDYSNISADFDNFSRRSVKDEPVIVEQETTVPNTSHEPVNEQSESDNTDDEFSQWKFIPESYVPKPLAYFPDPSLTLQERFLMAQKSTAEQNDKVSSERSIGKVKEMFDAIMSADDSKSDDWVTLIEDLANDIANMSLITIVTNEEMLDLLVEQVCHGLDWELALRQKQTGFKVRHLRAGLKLATVLFHCGDRAVSALLDASIPQKALKLYAQPQMSLPLRLLIFKCLNATCDTVQGVKHLIECEYDWADTEFSLKTVGRKILESVERTSVKNDENSDKTSSIEPQQNEDNIAFKTQNDTKIVLNNEEDDADDSGGPKVNFKSTKKPSLEVTLDMLNNYKEKPLTCYQFLLLILLSQPTTRITIAIGNLIKKVRVFQNLSKLSVLVPELKDETDDNVFEADEQSSSRLEQYDFEQVLTLIQDVVNLLKGGAAEIAQPNRQLPVRVQFQVRPNPSDRYIAIYKWLKCFKTFECIHNILKTLFEDSSETILNPQLELSIKLQSLCLLLAQQILDSPKGAQFFLSNDCCLATSNLLKLLAEKQPPKRSSHFRLSDGIRECPSASLHREESLLVTTCHDFSIRLSYSFKIFSCIDELFHSHRQLSSNLDEKNQINPEEVLHQLYIMADHPYGLEAILKHFSAVGNLDCLLRFLDMHDVHKKLEFVKETSIDYALELIGTFLRLNNNVLEIAEEYLDTLSELCKIKDKNLSARIKSLLPWLNPFDTDQPNMVIGYSDDTFRQLLRVIRKSIPNYSIPFARDLDFELPPQLITAVRILRQLCIPPQLESFIEANFDSFSKQRLLANFTKAPSFLAFVDSLPHQQNQNLSWNLNAHQPSRSSQIHNNLLSEDTMNDQLGHVSNIFKLFQPYDNSICEEHKYHYAVMQVFEQEGLRRLLNTLRELIGNYPRPIFQSAALSGLRGRIVISYIHSVVILLHSIVCHLIDARGSEFKDASVIPVILETYSLLCFVPKPGHKKFVGHLQADSSIKNSSVYNCQRSITLASDNYYWAQKTKKLILSILMSYTQMCLSVSDSEEKVISKSMWTKMLREVMDLTMSTPIFFHHGLDVLTKILPSPLPCSSIMDSIDQEQLFKNINHRKLWSAHLHPLHQQIEQMISQLCICYQSNIRILLSYFCDQLCDLSSNAACMVAKIITDTLICYATKLSMVDSSNGQTGGVTGEHQHESLQQQQPQLQQSQQQQQPQAPQQIQQQSQNQDHNDRMSPNVVIAQNLSAKGVAYVVRMILNLLSNLITNQAFETAFTNHLQVLGKRDEKLLGNLQGTLKLHEDYRPESIKSMNDNSSKDNYANSMAEVGLPPEELTKINLIELARKTSDRFPLQASLKRTYRLKVLMDLNANGTHRSNESVKSALNSVTSGLGGSMAGSTSSLVPPAAYNVAGVGLGGNVGSARYDPHASSGPANAMAVPLSYSAGYSSDLPIGSHKGFGGAGGGGGGGGVGVGGGAGGGGAGGGSSRRNRASTRPDSFRSRPQNTSRPPSIHVDDFLGIYGDSSSQALASGSSISSAAAAAAAARYPGPGPLGSKNSSSASLEYPRSHRRGRNRNKHHHQHM